MKNWINFTPLIIAGLFTIFILVLGHILPAKIPLFYSLPWGDNQLGNHQQLLIIPGIIVLITLVNLILSWQIHTSQIFFKKLLIYSSWLVSLILVITFLKIILIFI